MVLVQNFKGGPVKAFSAADLAGDIDIGQKMHFHLDIPVAGTGFAPSALDVEGIPAFLVSPGLGFRQKGKEIPDMVKDLGIGGGIASWGPADGFLVYIDDFIQ